MAPTSLTPRPERPPTTIRTARGRRPRKMPPALPARPPKPQSSSLSLPSSFSMSHPRIGERQRRRYSQNYESVRRLFHDIAVAGSAGGPSFVADAHDAATPEVLTVELLDRLTELLGCEYATYEALDWQKRIVIAYVPCSNEGAS